MATTAKRILPDDNKRDHHAAGQRKRKPMTRAHKAKLVKALRDWRSMSEEERAELAERTRQTQRERWANMTKKERDARRPDDRRRGTQQPSDARIDEGPRRSGGLHCCRIRQSQGHLSRAVSRTTLTLTYPWPCDQ